MEEFGRCEKSNNNRIVQSRLNDIFNERNFNEDDGLMRSRLNFLQSISEQNIKNFERGRKMSLVKLRHRKNSKTSANPMTISQLANNVTQNNNKSVIERSKRRRVKRLKTDFNENVRLTQRRKTLKDVASTVLLQNQICGTLFSETIKMLREKRRKVAM